MYMVSPAVYAKLLNCLDNVDTKMTQELNRTDVEETPVLRPSEQELQNIQNQELNITPEQQQQEPEVVQNIETDEISQQQQPEEIREAEEIVENFEQGDQNNENNQIMEPVVEPVPNILRTPCPNKTTDMRGNAPPRNIPCENKKTMLIVPSIMKRDKTAICHICDKSFSAGFNLRHHISTAHKKAFFCNICQKNFAREVFYDHHMDKYHPDFVAENNRMKLSNDDLEKLNSDSINPVVPAPKSKRLLNNLEFSKWGAKPKATRKISGEEIAISRKILPNVKDKKGRKKGQKLKINKQITSKPKNPPKKSTDKRKKGVNYTGEDEKPTKKVTFQSWLNK